MAPKTRQSVIQELQQLGETPPNGWTMTELKARLMELQEEKGIPETKTKTNKTELQQWVVALNKASKKKADLFQWCEETLGMATNKNETIAQVQKKAMERIYQRATAHGTDPVGFGEHSSLCYEELRDSQPGYAKWAIQTAQEGECSFRMKRLTEWLLQNPKDQEMPPQQHVQKGYNKKAESLGAGSSAKSEASSNSEMVAAMQMMMAHMESMKEEIEELRGRHHKKSNKEESDGNSSWSMPSQKPTEQ